MSVKQPAGAVVGIGAGCLVFVLIVVAAAYFGLGSARIDIARRGFPSGVELGESLHEESVGGFREGCVLVIFRLSDDDVQRLQTDAAAYLGTLGDATGRGQILSDWRETPMAYNEGLNGSVAWACSNTLHPRARASHDAAGRPGSYYATFAHGEGVLVLIPSERAAVFLYSG